MLRRPGDSKEWMAEAVCASVDPETWFPTRDGSSVTAKRICRGFKDRPPCPVRMQCLEYALRRDERFGVWGGLSERERNKLKRAG